MHTLSALIGIIFIVLVVLFSASNIESVTVSLWPLSLSLTAPLFIIILATATLSFVFGGAFVWLNNLAKNFANYRKQKAIAKAQRKAPASPNLTNKKDAS